MLSTVIVFADLSQRLCPLYILVHVDGMINKLRRDSTKREHIFCESRFHSMNR